MAKILSPIFKAKRTILSHQDGDGDESLEMDFRLGQGQAIEVFQTVAYRGNVVIVGTDGAAFANFQLTSSLHRRVGTLVDPNPAASIDELQYEIIHQVVYNTIVAQVAAESTFAQHSQTGPTVQVYREIFGKPLLLGGNLTIQVTDGGGLTGSATWSHVGFDLWYRYVIPTAKELVDAFFGRS